MRKKNNCTVKETDECLIDDAKVGRKNIPDEFSSIGVKFGKEKRKVGTENRAWGKVTVKLR